MKHDFSYPESLASILPRLLSADKIIIGLSGGADSVALTHILFSVLGPEKLICAHINHMIRGEEALRDEQFASDFADSLGITFRLLRKDVPSFASENHLGSEEAGRIVRYGFFNELTVSDKSVICTAHNADDNAETVLLNLARGTGLKGLGGIPLVRGNVLRPILSMTREEIESYCSENHLEYITDSTNLTDEYSRNKVRHKIIPELRKLNPAAVKNISRMSLLAAEDNEYLDKKAEKLLSSSKNRWGLSAEKLKTANDVILSRAIRLFVHSESLPEPQAQHVEEMIKVVRKGGSVDIPGNRRFYCSQGNVLLLNRSLEKFYDRVCELNNEYTRLGRKLTISGPVPKNSIKFNNLVFINFADYDKIKNSLILSARQEGDEFISAGRKIKKKLKKLMNEKKIPEPLRDNIFVVRDGNVPVFVEGIGVDSRYLVDDSTKTVITFSVV